MSVGGYKGSKFLGWGAFDSGDEVAEQVVEEEGYGNVMYNIPEEEFERWMATAAPVWDTYIEKVEAGGISRARQILEEVLVLCGEES